MFTRKGKRIVLTDDCRCTRNLGYNQRPPKDCPECKGTGRVKEEVDLYSLGRDIERELRSDW